MSLQRLLNALSLALQDLPDGTRLVLAYSGGRDSTALLHCLQALPRRNALILRLLHVNHHMQAAAADFESHCVEASKRLQLPLQVLHVVVDPHDGRGPEASARAARYQVLRDVLQDDEVLLLAHHQRDQAETFLLQAFRGSGVNGLAAMPVQTKFGAGQLRRPWLSVPAQAIVQAAIDEGWRHVDDPSNSNLHYRRNAVRETLWPSLNVHFPGVELALARAAQWQVQASEILRDMAVIDSAVVLDAGHESMNCVLLKALSPARQANVLRFWLHEYHGIRLNSAQMTLLQKQMASTDAPVFLPCSDMDGDGRGAEQELRSYRQHLWALPRLPADWTWQQQGPGHWCLANGWGELRLITENGFAQTGDHCWSMRSGHLPGRIHPAGHPHPLERKRLLQSLGVPDWLRQALPTLWRDNELLLIAGLLQTTVGVNQLQGVTIHWEGKLASLLQRCCVRR